MTPLQLFKCLADNTRLKSVLLINQLEEVCVCDLMEALALEQPKVSRHLAELRKCNIVQGERRGQWVYYRLHPQLPTWARAIINETVSNNQGYIADALAKLKTMKQQFSSC